MSIAKKIILFLISSLLFVLLLSYVLLGSSWGNRFILKQLSSYLDFEYRALKGNFLDGLQLKDVRYVDKQMDLSLSELSVKLSWLDLLYLRFNVDYLLVSEGFLQIAKPPISEHNEPLNNELKLHMPVDIELHRLVVENMNFLSEEKRYKVNKVSGKIMLVENQVFIDELLYQDQLVEGTLNGNIDTQQLANSELTYSVTYQKLDYPLHTKGLLTYDGDVRLLGDTSFSGEKIGQHMVQYAAQLTLQPHLRLVLKLDGGGNVLFSEKSATYQIDQFELETDLNDHRLLAALTVKNQWFDSMPITVGSSGHLMNPFIQISSDSLLGGKLFFDGTVKLSSEVGFSGRTTYENIDLSGFLNSFPEKNSGEFNISGAVSDTVNMIVSDLNSTVVLKGQGYHLSGELVLKDNRLSIPTLTVLASDGDGQGNISGYTDQDSVDVNIELNQVSLGILDKHASGSMSGSAKLSGNWPKPMVNLSASAQGIEYHQWRIGGVNVEGSGDLQDFNVDLFLNETQYNNHQLSAVKIHLNSDDAHLTADIDVQVDQYDSASMKYVGLWRNQSNVFALQGLLKQLSLESHVYGSWELNQPTEIVVFPTESWLNIKRFCLNNNLQSICANAAGNWLGKGVQPLVSQVNMKNIVIEPYLAKLPSKLKAKGLIDGQVVFDHQFKAEGTLDLNDSQLIYDLNGKEFIDSVKVGTVVFNSLNGFGVDMDIQFDQLGTFKQSMNFDGENIQGNGVIEIKRNELLKNLLPFIAEAKGQLRLKNTISGSLQQPLVQLQGNLLDGLLTHTQSGVKLTDIDLAVDAQPAEEKMYIHLVADDESGNVTLDGDISGLTKGLSTQLQVRATDFQFIDLPELKLKGNSDVSIEHSSAGTMVRGDITISAGSYQGIQTQDVIRSSPDAIIYGLDSDTKESQESVDIDVDVNINIEQAVSIDTLGLTTEVMGGLRIVMPIGALEPEVYGKLFLNKGTYEMYGQQLLIDRGVLDFNGDLSNPGIQLKATRRIDDDLLVGINIGGTINQLNSTLFSEPALPETDAFSYLLTGKNLNETSDINAGEQMGQAAVMLGLKSALPSIQKFLGVDSVQIKSGKEKAALAIEKKLNEKISVGYSYGLFSEVGFWTLKYQLTETLRLQSEYGEAQTIDLIYSIKRK